MLGGGAGHIAAMINTLKNNSLMSRKGRGFSKLKEQYVGKGNSINGQLQFKKLTPEERAEGRKRALDWVQARNKRINRSIGFCVVVAVIVILVAVYFVLR
jgi:hypothetical protein